jgi:ubiquinone/menaquinone biosynthesis C-methylase UbiE
VNSPLYALRDLMEQAGLINVFYREKNFGTVAIHVGTKIGG